MLPAGMGLLCSLANLMWVEPVATGIMFRRYELENVPEAQRDVGEFGFRWVGIRFRRCELESVPKAQRTRVSRGSVGLIVLA